MFDSKDFQDLTSLRGFERAYCNIRDIILKVYFQLKNGKEIDEVFRHNLKK